MFVRIIEPTYSYPFTDVKLGDFIYPVIDVDYNETNVTTLTKDDFIVDIGTKETITNNATYDETTSYYRLNVTVPSNEQGTKQDFWVNVTYNEIWDTDIEIEAVWYFTPTTTTIAPTTTAAPRPTAPPTTIPPPIKVSNFTLDTDLIQILLTPGKTEKKSIKVSNTGKTKLDITGKIQYLEQFLFFSGGGVEYTFELDLDETEEIEINFFVAKDQEPGVYPGKIVFTGDSIERTVLVIVEIESEKPLFDVKVEIPPEYMELYPGDNVMAELTLYNLGRIGRVDVDVEYGIKDLEGNVITSDHTILAVETQVSTVKTLNIPRTTKPDNYVFYATVTYNGIVGTGSSMFRVIERIKFGLSWILLLLIILFMIVLIILIIYTLKKRKRKKKRKKRLKKKK